MNESSEKEEAGWLAPCCQFRTIMENKHEQ